MFGQAFSFALTPRLPGAPPFPLRLAPSRATPGPMPVPPRPPVVDLSEPEALKPVQEQFIELALPRIEAHARVHFGYIRDPGRRDDAVATAVGIGWKHWLAAAGQGKDPAEFVNAIA